MVNDKENVSKTFDRAVEKLGLNKDVEDPRQKVVFHSPETYLRVMVGIRGTPILTITELMGHKTISHDSKICAPNPRHETESCPCPGSEF